MIGERIGQYVVEQQLAEGAMGVVYLVRRVDDSYLGALKLAHSEIIANPDTAVLVESKFSAAASVNHPHVVRVYDRGMHDRRQYMVMQYIDGGTLADEKRRTSFYETEKLLALMGKVTSAVAAVHAKPLVHCDLAPNNILVSEAGEPYVSDFGCAWGPWLSKRSRRISVTPPAKYAAPEVGAPEPSATSDVFTLGAVFSELLAETRGAWCARGLAKRKGLRLLDGIERSCRRAQQVEPSTRYLRLARLPTPSPELPPGEC